MSIVTYEKFDGRSIKLSEVDGEYCLYTNQVAYNLDYNDPIKATLNILIRNKHDFNGFVLVPNLGMDNNRLTEAQIGNLTYAYLSSNDVYLTEQGVYLFIMLSRKPKAVPFRRWVSELIKFHRQNKLALVNSEVARLVKNDAKRDNDYAFISSEIKYLHDRFSVLASEVKRLQVQEDIELNSCITTVQFHHLKDEGWKLIHKIALLKGQVEATPDDKRFFWQQMKQALKIPEHHKIELFSIKQFNETITWLSQQQDLSKYKAVKKKKTKQLSFADWINNEPVSMWKPPKKEVDPN